MTAVDLKKYKNTQRLSGLRWVMHLMWYILGQPFFGTPFLPFSCLKVAMLRLFGARVGRGVVIKPGVRIKYPWKLQIGDRSWIGESVWIDNLDRVEVGGNVCVSQGAYLCTGNHDWSKETFDLFTKPIKIEEGAWVGAQSIVCPGVTVGPGAVLLTGSVATGDLEPMKLYQGNPAKMIKVRTSLAN